MYIYPNSYYCYNHQNKGDMYVKALREAGFQIKTSIHARVILTDLDTPQRVKKHKRQLTFNGSRMFVYPHAARASVAWDGLFEPSGLNSATFVSAKGHVEILRAYGYDKPVYVAGWAYCPIKEFTPCENPRKILFAPIHPTRNNFLSTLDKKINHDTYIKLLKLVDTGQIELTVRFIRGLDNNGLHHDSRVLFIEGHTDLAYKNIEDADLIVSHQTFAYIALARGKPVIMMAEDTPPRNGGSEDNFTFVKSWDKYKDLLMYPLDILKEDDTFGLIQRASRSDNEYKDWRERMIGHPFDSEFVVNTIKSYL